MEIVGAAKIFTINMSVVGHSTGGVWLAMAFLVGHHQGLWCDGSESGGGRKERAMGPYPRGSSIFGELGEASKQCNYAVLSRGGVMRLR